MAILGIDEVGRGPWAGPLVIGAVILPEKKPDWTAELTDSKKLSAKKREKLNEIILTEAPATALGWVSSRELDKIGMSAALKLAVRRAVKNIKLKNIEFNEVIIDGTVNFLADTPLENYVSNLKKADFLIKEVSAASIIAKVARDAYMTELAQIYPNYGFEKHVGYGTAAHRKAISEFGITPEHRTSFKPIQQFLNGVSSEPKRMTVEGTTKNIGDRAETVVAEFLEKNGHKIVARNHKTPFYEIDIISVKGEHIYFTEVKYRKNATHGSPLEVVDGRKYRQMGFAAEGFLRYQPALSEHFSPLLAVAGVSGEDFELETWFPVTD